MNELQQVLESPNKVGIFLIVIAAIFSVEFLIKLWDYFKQRFGIETKSTLNEQRIDREIEGLKQETNEIRDSQKRMMDSQNKMIEKLDVMDQRVLNSEIERKRWAILDFANSINRRNYQQEAYNFILKTYDEYEKILEENGMDNGEVEIAISFIKKKYAEYMETGFPEG